MSENLWSYFPSYLSACLSLDTHGPRSGSLYQLRLSGSIGLYLHQEYEPGFQSLMFLGELFETSGLLN